VPDKRFGRSRERRQLIRGNRLGGWKSDGQRVAILVVDVEFIVKVGAACPAGLPDVTDDIPLGDAGTPPQAAGEALQVRVISAVSAMVLEHDEVSIPVPPPGERYDAVTGRLGPCAGRGTIIDPLVGTPLLKDRMAAHAEPRGDARELERRAQKRLAQVRALRGVVSAPSPRVLEPHRSIDFLPAGELRSEHPARPGRLAFVI
jgi:hypothetical protein